MFANSLISAVQLFNCFLTNDLHKSKISINIASMENNDIKNRAIMHGLGLIVKEHDPDIDDGVWTPSYSFFDTYTNKAVSLHPFYAHKLVLLDFSKYAMIQWWALDRLEEFGGGYFISNHRCVVRAKTSEGFMVEHTAEADTTVKAIFEALAALFMAGHTFVFKGNK